MKVAILGAGSFGIALAHVVSQNAEQTLLWCRNSETALKINANHQHPNRFTQLRLSSNIFASSDFEETLKDAEIILIALPMGALAEVMAACSAHIDDQIIVSTTKGIDPESGEFPSEIIKKALRGKNDQNIVVLSGPNFASEIIEDLPWAAVLASTSQMSFELVQKALRAKRLCLSYSQDVIGVELGGAIKNVYAIAAGVVDGLKLGQNARAALMTRALEEMGQFATVLGAEEKSIYGLAGFGDLLLSCTSEKSRNWRLGNALSKGQALENIEKELGEVIEGVQTTKACQRLAKKHGIKATMCGAVYSLLFENISFDEITGKLFGF